jgi:tape measure domain-containing protein|nr:MAG TPA: tail length tape measure protein [Caudoviricetes sp.]
MADIETKITISADSSNAERALNKVSQAAKQKLGGDISSELDKISAKAQKVFGQDLQGAMNKVGKGLQIAAAATGIGVAATAVKDLAVGAANLSDQMAQIRSRINLINDGSQTTAEIMDKIYAASQRSRGGYLEMADSVSKLNMLAKDAFSSNDEAIFFVEQLNKQFKISGASVEEATSAMYQLTQAMASGKLQGDEFRSIMENAPMLAQSIAQEMGMSVGQLKELSSQGLITADIIKNALYGSAEETNQKFAEIPMTFADIGQSIQNQFIQAFTPVLEQLASITSSSDFMAAFEGVGIAIRGVAAVAQVSIGLISAAFNSMKVVVSTVGNIIKSFATLVATSMPVVAAAIIGVTAAFIAQRAIVAAHSTILATLTVKTLAYRTAAIVTTAATKAWAAAKTALGVAILVTTGLMVGLSASASILRGLYAALRTGTLLASAAQAVFNAVLMANPIPIVVGLLATLAAAFGLSKAAAGGFSETMSAVWSSVVHTAVWGVNKIIEALNWLIAKLNSVGEKVAKFFGGTFTAIQQVDTISADVAQDIVNKGVDIASQITSGLDGGGGGLDVGGGGGGGSDAGSGKGGKGGGGGGKGKGEDLAKEAKQIHEKILQSFLEMQGNQVELIELQYKKEREELEKSKAANKNYQEDLKLLDEVYTDKRIKAKQEEFTKLRSIETKIRDMQKDFIVATADKDSTGSISPAMQLALDYTNAIDEIQDRYANMTDEFVKLDKMAQQHYIDTLKARGIAFDVMEDGRIAFTEQVNAEILAKNQEFSQKALEQHTRLADEKWAIDEAMRTQNFEDLQAALTNEYIAMQQNYELRKQLMEEYQQAVMDSHWNGQAVMFEAMSAGIDKMQEGISGLLQGTMSVTQAFQNMGKAILKTIADSVAQWIAAQVKQAVFGKMLQSQQTTTSIAAAKAQTPAWATLAQQMAMATFGMSSTAGMAAYQAATAAGLATTTSLNSVSSGGFSSFMDAKSMPKMASGGLAYGPTIAQIGEGRYEEAVIPLSDTVFDRLGEGISNANGGKGASGGITFNVNAIDSESFGSFLESRGGRALRQFMVNQDREFIGTEGTW